MTWHYGIIRKRAQSNRHWHYWYEIHEIFDIKGKLSWTENPINPHGETIHELKESLTMMLRDSYRFPIYQVVGGKLKKRGVRGQI